MRADNRGGTLHRVRQPRMQAELGRLAHRADEQQHGQNRERVGAEPEKHQVRPRLVGNRPEDLVQHNGVEQQVGAEDTQSEAEIPYPVDQERLDRGRIGRWPVVPEADQQVGREADALPSEEHLHQIVRCHQHQHREGKQRQVGEEPRLVRIIVHVADGIDVDHGRHHGHHQDHHRGQGIELERPGGAERSGFDPGEQHHGPGIVQDRHVPEHHQSEDHRDAHGHAGRQPGAAVTDERRSETSDQRAEQRQEHDRGGHARFTPSSG